MKILCAYCACGPSFIRTGWGRVFSNLGHTFMFWQPEVKPAFDVFSEFEPDIFIGTTFDLDRAIYKNIVSRPNMKVILYASAWGELIDNIDPKEYPIVIATEKEKELLAKLKRETGKPDFVFLHYHNNWIQRTLGGWDTIGIKPVSMLNAADLYDYYPGEVKEQFISDIAFVGGYWPYKGRNLNKFILPLCNKYKVKIFGNQPWPVPQYLGYTDTEDVKHIFSSAKICPNVSEPHSTDFGFDIVERPFKILSSGNFCISDYVQSQVEDIFHDIIPSPKTYNEFKDLIDYYLDKPEERQQLANKGKKLVLMEHTYFERVRDMFLHLGMFGDAEKTVELKKKFLQSEKTLLA